MRLLDAALASSAIITSMKNVLILITVVGLLSASCGSGDYPAIKYTNNYGDEIIFKTAEKDSPAYTLADGDTLLLSSAVPGRTEIRTINERLATWEYFNKKNVYDIQFVKRKIYDLEIFNFEGFDVTVTEKQGLLEDSFIIAAGSASLPDPEKTSTKIRTDQPVFIFINAPNTKFKLRRGGGTFILGINPPGGEWWTK